MPIRTTWAALARVLSLIAIVLAAGASGGCGGAPKQPADPLDAARLAGASAEDAETVGRWLLAEMLLPGGDTKHARLARQRLSKMQAAKGLYASFARAVFDESHGAFRSAAQAHLDAVAAARASASPDAPLIAWFSANHLTRLRSSVQGLWNLGRDVVMRTLEQPGNVGWRAYGELVEWWTDGGLRDELARAAAATKPGDKPPSLLDLAARRFGCVRKARMAGPFGHLAASDHRVRYDAERAGPWPLVFPRDTQRLEVPRTLAVERRGCQLRPAEPAGGGIYYVETFVDLPVARDVLIAVQGAFAVFVDDIEVLSRDTRVWGVWPRFGARVRLEAGRHRILARVGGLETSVRLLAPTGAPLGLEGSDDPAPPYAIEPPEVLPDPNPLDPFLVALGVPPQKGTPRVPPPANVGDPVSRWIASYLAHVEGQDDVASVLVEPLVKDPSRATGLALASQAVYAEKDPIFPQDVARDLAKHLRAQAAEKDPDLWWPRLWLALDEAEKVGLAEVAPKVTALADRFREVPDILKGLAAMYGRIGWKVEQSAAVKEAAARFPDDPEALRSLLQLYDEQGKVAEADRVAARIRQLEPDSEIDFERALERRDYAAAVKELERLGAARRDRKDIAVRIADLLTRAGASGESLEKLEQQLRLSPTDAGVRLALADGRFARGDRGALRRALVDAIQTGSETAQLREAIDLVEGMNELAPYRKDGRKVIAEFEASGRKLEGTAARVLDYAALWIHGDGSARMLEHEIIAIQSREAIQEHAEQAPRGVLLKIRTIKRDGRVLEPELVEGKPSVTMPHLEVGDYIEYETISTLRSDGQGGRRFYGPRWFFREEKLAYWLSELVVISPKNRPLDIEVGGAVPEPDTTESGALVVRRWRVDRSPALPEEPASAPLAEFLPNVRVGWGSSLDDTIARMVDAAADETPRDPRLVRIARSIIGADGVASGGGAGAGLGRPAEPGSKPAAPAPKAASAEAPGATIPAAEPPATTIDEKARRIYRRVLGRVQPGRESDPRRVIVGESGKRAEAFVYLCRLAGIDASLGVVRDRLTPPPRGPMSEAETFTALAVRIATEKGPRWMVVRDKYAPYGYLPSSLRGQPAIVLEPGAPREMTPQAGSADTIVYEGTGELREDGSAVLRIEQRFDGKFAIAFRSARETLPDARLRDALESRMAGSLPGARIRSLEVKNETDLDAPAIVAMTIEVSSFARRRGDELVVSPPFQMNLAALAALPARETPLYLSDQIATRTTVKLRLSLPEGARVTTPLAPWTGKDGDRVVEVRDAAEPGALSFDRTVDLPAGRVPPEAYPTFQEFARRGDASLRRDVVVALGRGRPAASARAR